MLRKDEAVRPISSRNILKGSIELILGFAPEAKQA